MQPYILRILCLVFIFGLSACQRAYRSGEINRLSTDPAIRPITSTIVYIIHGDGSYRYHDTEGNAYDADHEALKQGQMVAENMANAEVFIFHLKPKKRRWWIWPQKDGHFYYYRGGRLWIKEVYNRDPAQPDFEMEVGWYRKYTVQSEFTFDKRSFKRIMLYYGHEIPEQADPGYHASRPDMPFNINHLATGIQAFTTPSPDKTTKFDMLVLSSCYSGTPGIIASLGPYARYILASPAEVHLSYIDSRMLQTLDQVSDFQVYPFARRFARQAFEQLTRRTHTIVTLSLYDTAEVIPALNQMARLVTQKTPDAIKVCTVCGSPSYTISDSALPKEGIEVWYRPPRFGRLKDKAQHVGWGCWRATTFEKVSVSF